MRYKDLWFHGKQYILSLGPDNLWRDQYGVIYALSDDENTVDVIDRCGIGLLSLPEDHPANVGCKPHDYKYSSPAFQKFHVRSEADEDLEKDLSLLGYPIFGWFAKQISRVFGGLRGKAKLWENDETRDK